MQHQTSNDSYVFTQSYLSPIPTALYLTMSENGSFIHAQNASITPTTFYFYDTSIAFC